MGQNLLCFLTDQMLAEYLISVAVLFAAYCVLRWVYTGNRSLPPLPRHPRVMPGRGLEAGEISDRIKHLREEMKEPQPPHGKPEFKRALRVESERERVAKLAYFQAPPPTQPTEPQSYVLDVLLI